MEALIGNPSTFISEMIWTVINFFLLLFLLKKFLYTPVIRFMEDRQARTDAKLREETDARARVEENDERLANERAQTHEEAKRLVAQTGEELSERHTAAVKSARAEAVKSRKEAEAALAARREKTAEQLHEAAPEIAGLLAQHLLREE